MVPHTAPPASLGEEQSNRVRTASRKPRRPGWLAYPALFAIGAGVVLALTQDLGFSRSVTPGLVQRYAAKFGPDSRTRIGDWQQFVRSISAERRQISGDDPELLRAVNGFFNRLPFVSDLSHWRVEDYWASPAEALASNGADCEDFSIAKYFALKELGVPLQRLRITYVKALSRKDAHMVLAYYPEPDAMPLILDNLINEVKPASERLDLTPVYSFNDEDLLIVRQGQRDTRAGSATQIRQWRYLLDKLKQELHY